MSVREAVDRVREHAERKHVCEQHAEYGRDHHIHPADGGRRLPETEPHEQKCSKYQARFELERVAERIEEVARTEAFDGRGNATRRRCLLLLNLGQRPAQRSAERADPDASSVRLWTDFTES